MTKGIHDVAEDIGEFFEEAQYELRGIRRYIQPVYSLNPVPAIQADAVLSQSNPGRS